LCLSSHCCWMKHLKSHSMLFFLLTHR
jgi:hypothetical protein